MKEYYTTGEVTKLCNVSMRTVQYYDKCNLVKPNQISDGGRRLYSHNEVKKIELVLLYKELNFSLDEIKVLINGDLNIIENYTQNQIEMIKQEIDFLKEKEKRLIVLNEEIRNNNLDIDNIKKLKDIVHKYDEHQKNEKKIYLYLIGYTVFLFIGAILLSDYRDYGMGIYIVVSGVLLLLLIGYHQKNNAYICPHCQKKIDINFIKDMLSLNNGKKGKILKCPYCGYKGSMKETYVSKHQGVI